MTYPTVTPASDADRVLGQIQRGEIRCDRDAAREIAARQEEEYGIAFRGTPAEALLAQLEWAAALAGLSVREAA